MRTLADRIAVWFIYPETANVRLEDMNSIFGDATSVQPTPQTLAEAESLFSGDARSPVPSLDIRRGAAESAIPGLNIDPPDNVDGLDSKPAKDGEKGEGIGGWISNMVKRTKGNGEGDSSGGQYRRVGQDEED